MDDGTKKAGGIVAAIMVAIGGFAVKSMDSCASVGARTAGSADDFARVGARSGDDLGSLGRYGGAIGSTHGDELGGFGRHGDDLTGTGAIDDLEGAGHRADGLGPSRYDIQGRTGGSFGGSRFGEPAAWADDAIELGEDAPLHSDALEVVADALVEIAPDVVEFTMADGEAEGAWPARPAPYADGSRPIVMALGATDVAGAEISVESLEELDGFFGTQASIDLIVARGDGRRILAGREQRSAEAILLRAAQVGDRAVLLVCDTTACMADAARVATMAAQLGNDDIANRLVRTRDRFAPRAGITLHRLRASEGGLQLVTSEPTAH